MTLVFRILLLLALLLPSRVARAQAEVALSGAWLQAIAPERDDPDDTARELTFAALQGGSSPVAPLLLEEALRRVGELQQPVLLLELLDSYPKPLGDGLARQRAAELRFRLQIAAGVTASSPACRVPLPPADPFAQYARSVLAVGPFGDDGDHWLGVCLPPELEFPAPDRTLPGRTGPVQPRAVERRPFARRLSLARPARPEAGCYYALHRVAVPAPQPCFLEVEGDGALQVFLNGREVGRIQPLLDQGPWLRWLPAVLAPGVNQVLLKTCTNGRSEVSLRYVDPQCRPLPALREVPAAAPLEAAPPPAAEPPPAPMPDVAMMLQQAAAASQAPVREGLEVAAALAALRRGATGLLLRLLVTLQATPPEDATARLCLAQVIRATEQWPEEQRNAAASALEEPALAALGEGHHAAAMARVHQFEQQDRGEEGLRLLRARIERGRAGPASCEAAVRIAQHLHFDGELPSLLAAWHRLCPDDPRPLLMQARRSAENGGGRAALVLACRAVARRPGDQAELQAAYDRCQECGDPQLGEALVALWFPPFLRADGEPLAATVARAALARTAEDRRRRLAAVVAHPEADAGTLRRAGERLLQLGDREAAADACRKSLLLDPDQPSQRELLARATDAAMPQGDLLRFRRDGDAAIAAFKPGERERSASTTLVLDQMIVELLPDGSRFEETHQVRRINDQAGVEAMREAAGPGSAEELLLLRTVSADGKSYVPLRVGRTLAMPRLEPGAFLEWRYRNHVRSPGAGPWRSPRFSFRSGSEPYVLSELVLVLPEKPQGELRKHEFPGAPERVALDGNRTALVFHMQDMERLPDEQRAPPEEELVPAVAWGEDAAPGARLRATAMAILVRCRVEPAVQDLAARLCEGKSTDQERLQAIAAFCDRDIESGPAENPTGTLLRRKGDRFTLRLALCRALGLTVEPGMCASERDAPSAGVGELFRDWDQLDTPCARVLLRDGPPVWLFRDAERYWPAGEVPGGRAGARAMLAQADRTVLTRVGGPLEGVGHLLVVRGKATLDEKGMAALRCRVEVGDAAGFDLAERLRQVKADERELAARQIAQGLFQGWRVRSAAAVLEPGKPLRLDAELQRRLLQPGGEGRWLLSQPLPGGQFVATFGDRSERKLPLCIDEEAAFDWQIEVEPGPFRPAFLPEPVAVQQGTLDYTLQWRWAEGLLQLQRKVSLRACRVPVDGFAAWMRTLEQLDRAEQQTVTLVR